MKEKIKQDSESIVYKKIRRWGGSLVIALSPRLLRLANLKVGDYVKIVVVDGGLSVSKVVNGGKK